MAKEFQRSTVAKLSYSPNVLTLPLHWRPSFAWMDVKNTSPSRWPTAVQNVLRARRGGIYIFYDVSREQPLYVGRTRDLRTRFQHYQNSTVRAKQKGVSQIDNYEREYPGSEIRIYVAWCTEIEYMFIKSYDPLWNTHHSTS